ncbi:tRNA uridine-5-carboxymethylaminomethyl(34) synthesis enzyme MnmG [Emergencia timonensis]|uniref:tRNA uridine-5-carboxymethylaminomethyl(34) synthesis enzyme MnmG n=1 Tax=Emergencia timonensis TaxID=1776384 RepID=UPI001D095129|nr:tRNA uridine-5-carboxymethylaminomethyl(34) synthesis enzyme MnmG [Emergencia timonensis]MBS6177407.1 tRNA uridine-5-carboxymethylaminomethyl(34) synthesis enzyme MnmG [Clostridiales bacterium]MCB6476484.1 tRNA uridine-5-carboxymethylaminomethyl(34) synthesis enzyme MnmG [Emergencia timonensis]BDF10648.1 tRNA uridine 5-carboxymethylaminomethyl modification enzyme MnmG [Emergencia timonensis]BDF14732.1 tRNA uridine 5-carboxymethylaminomethyl modification enzyme MnmG [Emergencia timonensis]
MEKILMGKYDIIVVGAGHAGCEAALAAARLGNRTLLFSINLEAIAMMPCNPSIGGTGKGHLVREIDALGGEMGKNIDKTFIQSRMLNTAKGPAVHSLRAQADKDKYHLEMKKTIEKQPNLDMKQAEVVELLVEEGQVCGIVTKTHTLYRAKAVILATGTFLRGKIFIGDSCYSSGPNGLAPSVDLAENLKNHGMKLRRFKTGTPARALASSFDYAKMTEQKGDAEIVPFSFMNDYLEKEQISCWLTYTNEDTHTVIRNNFHRSALFGGQIEGIGPRYCPSIEDKVNRFADKKRHQTFIEPEGLDTEEMYIQGMSSSLPEDVQEQFYHTIPGLENIIITRPAYAIEYDCIDPLDLKPNLESRYIRNLFCAGQFNGSSGYEEAAAQGLMAGINAALLINGKEPFVLDRSEAYIGVLIDDLVTKGTNEPYRIMTSRAEYRLVLRQDNADLRLTEKSYRLGLATEERYQRYVQKKQIVEKERIRMEETFVSPKDAKAYLEKIGSSPIQNKASLAELLKRPEVTYDNLIQIDQNRPQLSSHEKNQLEVQIKYEGYITKQMHQIERFKKLENKTLNEAMDYESIEGLRIEAAQKLNQIKPRSVGQASRISGVSPADINVLLVYLEKMRRKK